MHDHVHRHPPLIAAVFGILGAVLKIALILVLAVVLAATLLAWGGLALVPQADAVPRAEGHGLSTSSATVRRPPRSERGEPRAPWARPLAEARSPTRSSFEERCLQAGSRHGGVISVHDRARTRVMGEPTESRPRRVNDTPVPLEPEADTRGRPR